MSLHHWKNRLLKSLAVLALLLLLVQPAAAQSLAQRFALHSTGWVVIPKENGRYTWGTGTVVDQERRWFITNYHVVGDYTRARVYFPMYQQDQIVYDKNEYLRWKPVPGQVLYVSPKRDLSLIQLDYLPKGVRELPLAEHSAAQGDEVYYIGNSSAKNGTLWTYHKGTVKGKGFYEFSLTNTSIHLEALQVSTDAETYPGDSGGPVINELGQLVAVHSNHNKYTGPKGIDVFEVKEFLNRINHPQWKENLSSPVEGIWTLRWKNRGKSLYCGLTFRNDGTLSWDTDKKTFAGTYSYKDGTLLLVVPGLRIREHVALSWNGIDQFAFTSGRTEFAAERR